MEGILIPHTVFIGDDAEFLYPLNKLKNFNKNNFKLENILLKKNYNNSKMTITKIELKTKDNQEYLSISFIPWETGEIEFTSFQMFGIKQSPKVSISSILETTKTEILQPSRKPLLIPGTIKLIYTNLTIIIILIFINLFIISMIKQNFLKKYLPRLQKKRIKKLNKNLKRLNKQYNSKKSNLSTEILNQFIIEWLKDFEGIIKDYTINIIESKKTIKSKNLTYTEILNNLKNEFNSTLYIYLEYKDIFTKLQKLRFGKMNFNNLDFNDNVSYFINKSYYISKITEEQIQKKYLKDKDTC